MNKKLVCTLLCFLFLTVLVGCFLRVQQRHIGPGIYCESNVCFLSHRQFNEVVVPFFIENGDVYVWANIDGKKVLCLLDTGTTDILWPQELRLGGVDLPKYHYATYGADGRIQRGRVRRLSSIDFGGYEILGVNTAALERSPVSPPHERAMILGNTAFSRIILTVDWRRQKLVLRNKDYNVANEKLSPKDYLCDFEWVQGSPFHPGLIAIRGSVEGHPMRFILDTGEAGTILTEAFATTALGHKKRKKLVIGSRDLPITAQYVDDVEISVANINARVGACILPKMNTGTEGLLGSFILRDYRVTIDYPRKKVLFQAY